MPRTNIVSAFQAGSGRAIDLSWPLVQDMSAAVSPSWNSRIQASNGGNFGWATTTTGVGSAVAFAVQGNIPCVKMTSASGAAGVGFFYSNNQTGPRPRLVKGQAITPLGDDLFVARVYANIAYGAAPTVDTDWGVELVCPANDVLATIVRDSVGGIGWTRRANGHVAAVVRGGLGTQFFEVTTPGFDPTAFHSYEMVLTSATAQQEAGCRFLLDGVPFQSFAWGAGTILPSLQPAYQQMKIILCNLAGVSTNMFIQRFAFIQATSAAGTL